MLDFERLKLRKMGPTNYKQRLLKLEQKLRDKKNESFKNRRCLIRRINFARQVKNELEKGAYAAD